MITKLKLYILEKNDPNISLNLNIHTEKQKTVTQRKIYKKVFKIFKIVYFKSKKCR